MTLTGVYGNWITQRALQSPASRRSAQWVGIGDFDIIQTGTDSNYNCGLFCSNYSAWYELYTQNAQQGQTPIPIAVSPGDQIYASIKFINNTSTTTNWNITLIDINDGVAGVYRRINQSTDAFASNVTKDVEWIDERPARCNGCTAFNLSNFINATFYNSSFAVNRTILPHPINYFNYSAIAMFSNTNISGTTNS